MAVGFELEMLSCVTPRLETNLVRVTGSKATSNTMNSDQCVDLYHSYLSINYPVRRDNNPRRLSSAGARLHDKIADKRANSRLPHIWSPIIRIAHPKSRLHVIS